MKVVIAMDSFKGSMTSLEAGYAARDGVLKACGEACVVVKPVADGGEGTTEALVEGLGGTYATVEVAGPFGEPVTAKYGILPGQKTAVIEMAEAAGIILAGKNKPDPWKASTTGVGEMILDAAGRGCREFIIGIGGSATTEGGIGMLQALGYKFYDAEGNLLPPVPGSLGRIKAICAENVPEVLKECHFQVACDITNPLCGENGAVYVYGPQKGVKQDELEALDKAMLHYAGKTAGFTGKDNRNVPGAGAAGGLGFAFLSFFQHVGLKPGISVVLEAVGLEAELKDAGIVITGEGRMDSQTAMGKVPAGIAHLAKKYNCKVIAFAGSVTEDAGRCNEEGIHAFFPVVRGVTTMEEAMDTETAKKNLLLSVEQVFRLLQ